MRQSIGTLMGRFFSVSQLINTLPQNYYSVLYNVRVISRLTGNSQWQTPQTTVFYRLPSTN